MSKDSPRRLGPVRLSDGNSTAPRGRIAVLASTAVVLFTFGFMYARSPGNTGLKIGYVDSSTILNLLPAAQTVQAQLDTLVQEWSDTINQMTDKYQKEVDDFERQSGVMSPQAKQRTRSEIADLQQKIISYREERVGQGGELDRIRAQLLKPIRASIYDAIARVARREGLRYVLDKNDQTAVVLYADPRYDITYKVMDILTLQRAHS